MAYRIGLSPEIFWRLNPRRIEPYLSAYEQSRREERDKLNFEAWLTGHYVAEAITSCFSKGAKYPSEPIDLRSRKELDDWHSSPEYLEQRRILMKAKELQEARKKRRAKKKAKKLTEKGAWISGG